MPTPISRAARLRAELDALRDEVASVRLELEVAGRPTWIGVRNRAIASVETHLDNRLGDLDAPLLVVVFGPTGSGKSTLTNTLAGRQISRSGVLRPTTTEAVVWCHRRESDRLRRSALAATGPTEIVDDDHQLLQSIVVIDTPDIDSIATEHRIQTERILLMADAAIAVTTPQRYADAVPWELLADLTARGMPLRVVMNRTDRRSSGAVTDLAGLLRERGVGGVRSTDDILTIQEQRVRGDGRLSNASVRRILAGLEDLATRHEEVVRAGVTGAVERVAADALLLANAIEQVQSEADRRLAAVDQAYRSQFEEIEHQLASGDLVRAEVVERWRRLVGVGDLARIVSRGASRVRDVVVPREVEQRADAVGSEVRSELFGMTLHRMERASSLAAAAWEIDPAGAQLLAATEKIDRGNVEADVGMEIDAWLASVVALVASQGKSRFRLARVLTIGVNAAATLILLAVFASTGGLTGGEVGVVAGTAAAQQTILEHVFGSAAASRLASQSRRDLVRRLSDLLEADADRFRQAVRLVLDDPGTARRLREAAHRVEQALVGVADG